jgi:hypothetical protein
MLKLIVIINILIYFLAPVACLAHDLEIHERNSSSNSSHFLNIETNEAADIEGEQDCELHSRRTWMLACYHAASDNFLILPLISIPIVVPPEFLS